MDIEQLLSNSGHSSLLPLQKATIHAFGKNDHVRLIAQTGSGKTIAFLLSAISEIKPGRLGTQVLILAPTRELALQVRAVLKSFRSNFTNTVCYGGHPVKTERNELAENPTIIIATPGRMLDHLKRGHVKLDNCKTIVVDEFDKCLEFGFESEMNAIRSYLPESFKTLFVSATELSFIPKPWDFERAVTLSFQTETMPVGLKLWTVKSDNLFDSLVACLTHFKDEPSVVFCNYREVSEDVSQRLNENNLSSIAYHGGMNQNERELALIKFRNGSVLTLICTDLGARGLDIENIKHVIHYQFPESEAAYIHRNGRTARANQQGNGYVLHNDQQILPDYLELPERIFAPVENQQPVTPRWVTLYFGAGKKDKLRKLDIVGFLSQQGELDQKEIGKIDVLDHVSFAAIASRKSANVLRAIRGKRIKGKRIVIKKAK